MDNPFARLLESILDRVEARPMLGPQPAPIGGVASDPALTVSALELHSLIAAAGQLPVIWNVDTDTLTKSSAEVISSYLETAGDDRIVMRALTELLGLKLVQVSRSPAGKWSALGVDRVGEMRQLETVAR